MRMFALKKNFQITSAASEERAKIAIIYFVGSFFELSLSLVASDFTGI